LQPEGGEEAELCCPPANRTKKRQGEESNKRREERWAKRIERQKIETTFNYPEKEKRSKTQNGSQSPKEKKEYKVLLNKHKNYTKRGN